MPKKSTIGEPATVRKVDGTGEKVNRYDFQTVNEWRLNIITSELTVFWRTRPDRDYLRGRQRDNYNIITDEFRVIAVPARSFKNKIVRKITIM